MPVIKKYHFLSVRHTPVANIGGLNVSGERQCFTWRIDFEVLRVPLSQPI